MTKHKSLVDLDMGHVYFRVKEYENKSMSQIFICKTMYSFLSTLQLGRAVGLTRKRK